MMTLPENPTVGDLISALESAGWTVAWGDPDHYLVLWTNPLRTYPVLLFDSPEDQAKPYQIDIVRSAIKRRK